VGAADLSSSTRGNNVSGIGIAITVEATSITTGQRGRLLGSKLRRPSRGTLVNRCALRCRALNFVDSVEVRRQSALSLAIEHVFDPHDVADFLNGWQLFQPVSVRASSEKLDREMIS
jgi:hypothetical protein